MPLSSFKYYFHLSHNFFQLLTNYHVYFTISLGSNVRNVVVLYMFYGVHEITHFAQSVSMKLKTKNKKNITLKHHTGGIPA